MRRLSCPAVITILEMIGVLMVMIAVLTVEAYWMKRSADERLIQGAAENLQKVMSAVQMYARDNYPSLMYVGEKELTLKELTDNEYLNDGFPIKNSFSQTYRITIKRDEINNVLKLLVITEVGEGIDVAKLGKIADIAARKVSYVHQFGITTGHQEGLSLPGTGLKECHLAFVSYVSDKDVVNAEGFLSQDK